MPSYEDQGTGYDPHASGYELQGRARAPRREGVSGNKPVNAKRAKELMEQRKLTYRETGIQLAREEGRRTAYSESTMHRALNKKEPGRG